MVTTLLQVISLLGAALGILMLMLIGRKTLAMLTSIVFIWRFIVATAMSWVLLIFLLLEHVISIMRAVVSSSQALIEQRQITIKDGMLQLTLRVA